MPFFGNIAGRLKAAVSAMTVANSPGLVPRTLFGAVLEPWAGAWQRGMTLESRENITAFSAVYACVSRIASDIAMLRPKLMLIEDGIWTEVEKGSPAFLPVFRKPNRYQTWIQFLMYWVTSKLLYGVSYTLKERDGSGIVRALYGLDPRCVTAMVAEDGDVFYQIKADWLAGVNKDDPYVPASEIIADRGVTLFHPLCAVSPIYACAYSATQGIRIQANSEKFFANMSRPSGHLTADGVIPLPEIARLKQTFEQEFGGGNIGRLLVTGNGLKYEPMTIPANDAQLIEQLKWTVEDVARCFHVPPHKIGLGQNPTFNNIGALNQDYLTQCLQIHIESIELLLDEGLALPSKYGTELDLDTLLRMDQKSQAETNQIEVASGVLSPNEARFIRNRKPVTGGDSPLIQQQNFSLEALAKRDAKEDPFGTTPAPAAPDPNPPPADKGVVIDAEFTDFFTDKLASPTHKPFFLPPPQPGWTI